MQERHSIGARSLLPNGGQIASGDSLEDNALIKTLMVTTVAALAIVSGARAADLPTFEEPAPVVAPVPTFAWTGFYVGIHGGYSFGENDDNIVEFDRNLDGTFGDTVFTAGGANAFSPGFASDFDDGVNVGGRIGYDWQFGNFVLGAVADASYVDIEDNTTAFSVTPAFYSFDRELEYLVTGRLRAGVAFDRVLAYATGGFAYGGIDQSFSTNSPAVLVSVSEGDDDAWGYTVGAGVEGLLTQNVSIGAEYLYTDLDVDTQTARFSGGAFGAGTDMRPVDDEFDFHTVRATLSYRFNSGM
jgi:outer membrane immunogenic protein